MYNAIFKAYFIVRYKPKKEKFIYEDKIQSFKITY